ncbi:hypothetical protein I656_01962 [Geobacillus sp. WSUCF1]|nr:hypothetical protein I656_01962 [Geobacillus sp. WSUCF1]WJQ05904.1 ATP-binding protein [Geobacillus stearothermophilus]
MKQKVIGNPFVTYLDKFNVLSPNHSKIYDEYNREMETEESFDFTIATKIEEHLKNIFSNNPHSVILTGNAGDGKTRLCRLIHDQFSDKSLVNWPENGVVTVQYEKGTIKIVKDLSELKEEIIYGILLELQRCVCNRHKDKVFFLIAANEGKLSKVLMRYNELSVLRQYIMARFDSYENNDDHLSVINLLDVTSSVYVERVLNEWNKEEYWKACEQCEKKPQCIIYLNHRRTSQPSIQRKIVSQYRLLDYLETHITLREMLIHMSYLITGGYVCKDILEADHTHIREQSKKAYYQNFYGVGVGEEGFSEMKALRAFRSLDPGLYSYSPIDDFIMNGDINGDEEIERLYNEVFDDDLDIEFDYFKKKVRFYREYGQNIDQPFLEHWMPKLRRKVYFELEGQNYLNTLKLLPFEYLEQYIGLFDNDSAQSNVRKDLVNGLNRAFSRRLTHKFKSKGSFYLKVSNETLMIYGSFDRRKIELLQEKGRDDLDHLSSKFFLVVDGEVRLKINLSVFEYLMRLSSGGTHNILSQEVEILLNTFRNELIRISEPDMDVLEIYRLDKDSGVYVEHVLDE